MDESLSPIAYRIPSGHPCSDDRGFLLSARLRRAALRLERTFCGPVGPCPLWKPPRYFSASKSERLVIARRNQIGECVRVVPIVEAPRKLVHIERQIIFADFVIRAHDAALQEGPEAFDCVCVNRADNVLARAVTHDAMRQIAAQSRYPECSSVETSVTFGPTA